ncbi:MAG: hypothetical protein F9K29_08865 [Hyphomicrobiaceae bacterium]|nr:MAG: hypothetical protein F9K29_08865 [Hyphomicrobiaceae bacterium]
MRNYTTTCRRCGLQLSMRTGPTGPALAYDMSEWKRRCKHLERRSPALCIAEQSSPDRSANITPKGE